MYFKDGELRCKHCGILKLHRGFRDELNTVRGIYGKPLIVRSCCRCKEHNSDVGGHPRSLHVGDFPHHADKGQQGALAVDLETLNGYDRGRLFTILWVRGWSIGWGNDFLHCDRRDWIYLPQTSFDYSA